MKQRNGQIDFWRFVGSIMIVMVHSQKIIGEYRYSPMFALWVDFFFIVTGYFLSAAIYKTQVSCNSSTLGDETVKYTLKKIGSFYHFFIFFSITAFIAKIFLLGIDSALFNEKNLGMINDFLMIYSTGIPSVNLFVGEWYLSAMVIAIFIIYPLARRYTNVFENIIAPLVAVLLFGLMLHNDGQLTDPGSWYMVAMKGTFRAIAGVCLGIVAHKIADNIKKSAVFDTTEGKVFITAIDILAIPLSIILMIKGVNSKYSSAVIFLLFVGITVSLSTKSYITKLFSNKLCVYLGKLSLTVFLGQGTVIYLMNYIKKMYPAFNTYISTANGETVCVFILISATLLLAAISIPICNGIKSFILSKIQILKEKAQKSGQN